MIIINQGVITMKKQDRIEILIAKSLIRQFLTKEECEELRKINESELVYKYGLDLEEAKAVCKWCNLCKVKLEYKNKNIRESIKKKTKKY